MTATDGESFYATMRTGPVALRLPSKAGAMFAGVKRRRATQRVRYVVRIAQPIRLICDHCSNLYLSFFISLDGRADLVFQHHKAGINFGLGQYCSGRLHSTLVLLQPGVNNYQFPCALSYPHSIVPPST